MIFWRGNGIVILFILGFSFLLAGNALENLSGSGAWFSICVIFGFASVVLRALAPKVDSSISADIASLYGLSYPTWATITTVLAVIAGLFFFVAL